MMGTADWNLEERPSDEFSSSRTINRRHGRTDSESPYGNADGHIRTSAQQLARGLGWFSIGLGLAEVLAPRAVARLTGVRRDNVRLIQLFGMREIASGVAIFLQGDRPSEALWSRVAGDALDLASLGIAFASPESHKARVGFATANVLAVTAVDLLCAREFSRNSSDSANTHTRRSLVIDRPAEELYQAWRNFEQLPRFMRSLKSVTVTGDRRSHWVAQTPAGITVQWDAKICEDRPNELISWRSVEAAEVANSGSVRFMPAPGNRGTIVTVELNYDLPGGAVTSALAKFLREDPGALAQESLRLFKQIMEIGEVTLSDGALWDSGYLTQRPAQPINRQEPEASKSMSASGTAAAAGRGY